MARCYAPSSPLRREIYYPTVTGPTCSRSKDAEMHFPSSDHRLLAAVCSPVEYIDACCRGANQIRQRAYQLILKIYDCLHRKTLETDYCRYPSIHHIVWIGSIFCHLVHSVAKILTITPVCHDYDCADTPEHILARETKFPSSGFVWGILNLKSKICGASMDSTIDWNIQLE